IIFHPFVMRYVGDPYFNGEVGLCVGIATNFVFAAVNGCTGVMYRSPWFIALSIYYVLLAVIRVTIFLSIHKQNHEMAEYDVASWERVVEWIPYRRTGILLFGLTASMTSMVIQMIFDDRAFIYPGYILYVFLVFAVYLIVGSSFNMFKYRRWGFPSLSASAAVSFTGALMAVLAAQSALLHQFSPNHTDFRMIMNTITGSIVLLICYALDLNMIRKGFSEVYRCRHRLPMPELRGLSKFLADKIERRD
ncbi:MAG: cation transporter, partial [Firmicutes bacterium]|nr:cation transporter [Bacillota bacterium]